jgi:hypothetical protein
VTSYEIVILLTGGVILPIVCIFQVFVSRSRVYARWTKLAVIVVCLAALAWCALSWVLLQSTVFGLTHEAYDKLVGIRGWFGGIYLGIVFSIWIARPYQRKKAKGVKSKREARSGRFSSIWEENGVVSNV